MSRPRKPTAANHPLIAALFQELPTPGTLWPIQDRQKWHAAVGTIFDMVYSAPQSTQGSSLNFPPGVRGVVGGGFSGSGNARSAGMTKLGGDSDLLSGDLSEIDEEEAR